MQHPYAAGAGMFDPSQPNQRRQPTDWGSMHFETRAIRSGQDPDPTTGSVVIPLNMASTYRHDAVGTFKGYEYGRTGNPTRTALEDQIAALENSRWALCYGSGTAAAQNITWLLNPGDEVLLSDDIYSGTYRFLVETLSRYGIKTNVANFTDLAASRAAMTPQTKLVWVETPTNPNLRVTDIADMAAIAHEGGALLVVDNTFATPYLQQPLALGADIVLYSTTKYMGGHSDVVGGALTGNDTGLWAFLQNMQNAAGAVPSPFDCWLTVRGLKTLAVRMDRHSANALAVARFLESHPAVEQVFYPGLPSHSGHEIAKRQMKAFSGMVSFTMKDGPEAAKRVVERTRLFLLAESLGGVESLIEHPGKMTHISVDGTAVGVSQSLIRSSVGIEHVDDLIADLEQALA
jgi:cystathionine gamma-synthase